MEGSITRLAVEYPREHNESRYHSRRRRVLSIAFGGATLLADSYVCNPSWAADRRCWARADWKGRSRRGHSSVGASSYKCPLTIRNTFERVAEPLTNLVAVTILCWRRRVNIRPSAKRARLACTLTTKHLNGRHPERTDYDHEDGHLFYVGHTSRRDLPAADTTILRSKPSS